MQKLKIFVSSNAHIDSEWLWSLKETIEVCKNTFSNVLILMEKYPELTFIQGSSLYYELIEKNYPYIFEKIKNHVRRGNWKVVGGTFLEFDPNMPSGESLVRHFLIGQKYFKKKFGMMAKTLWLPDSFGFPASLPQLLKKANIEYFATYKLRWNDTTEIPYFIFKWKSKDDSTILGLNIPGNYSDYLFSMKKILFNYYTQSKRQKIPILMQVFGIGDHGGGPEEKEVINILKWKKEYKHTVSIRFSGFEEFFDEIKGNYSKKLPLIIDNELYLEFHRGVFTTGAKIKWLNRYNENMIILAEKIYSLLKAKWSIEYPKDIFDELWKEILLNQSHDMISSSVAPEVYRTGIKRGLHVKNKLDELVKNGLRKLARTINARHVVFNPLSWETSVYVRTDKKIDGYYQCLSDNKKLVYIEKIPPMGYKTINKFEDKPPDSVSLKEMKSIVRIENKYLFVDISRHTGWILKVHDKMNKKDILTGPIRLRVYYDYPLPGRGNLVPAVLFDAWEIYIREGINKYFFKDLKAKDVLVKEKGEYYSSVVSKFEYKQFRRKKSKFELEVGLYADKQYVEISFFANWNAWHRLLKLVIPLRRIHHKAIFEIPYGTIKRYDAGSAVNPRHKAKYEVCGQRWIDISNERYGISVINDSKYGYSWINGIVEISLLRAPTFPLREALLIDRETYKKVQASFLDYKIANFKSRIQKVFIHFLLFQLNLLLKYAKHKNIFRPMDQGIHRAQFWIYPHKGNFDSGLVPKFASELNTKYIIERNHKIKNAEENTVALIEISPRYFIHITALKIAEEVSDGLIIRLFNSSDKFVKSRLKFNFEVEKVNEVNLIETKFRNVSISNSGTITLSFKPHEIKTLLVKCCMKHPVHSNKRYTDCY